MSNLLVVTNGYPNEDGSHPAQAFVKGSVDPISEYYDHVTVISPQPYYPKILSKLNIGPELFVSMNDFQDYEYGNIEVRYPKYFILPSSISQTARRNQWRQVKRKILSYLNKTEREFDEILCYFNDPSGLATRAVSEEVGLPYHLVIQENSGWFNKLAEQERIHDVWREAETIFRVNPNDVDLLKKYNENTHYVPNGYDPDVFYPVDQDEARKELGLNQDETILVNVAALKIHHKNQLNLVRAFSQLQDSHPSHLYLVGEGPDRGRIQEEVNELGVKDMVHLVGRVPHEDINLWMNAADLFVLPSYHEGNPTVMFECLRTGTPQVLSDVGGIASTVDNICLIENHREPVAILEKIKEALNRQWDQELLIAEREDFTWSSIAEKILQHIPDSDSSKDSRYKRGSDVF